MQLPESLLAFVYKILLHTPWFCVGNSLGILGLGKVESHTYSMLVFPCFMLMEMSLHCLHPMHCRFTGKYITSNQHKYIKLLVILNFAWRWNRFSIHELSSYKAAQILAVCLACVKHLPFSIIFHIQFPT